jgi:hypothetical protein
MADEARAGASPSERRARPKLPELALFFLRLGFTAFGGPAAHIAIMENEVVRRRRWLSSERFLDLLGAANLLPGPSSAATSAARPTTRDRSCWRAARTSAGRPPPSLAGSLRVA